MNVALTYPGCHRWGGVERVMLECANYLAERGHSTHVYASEWDPQAVHPRVIRHPISLPQGPPLFRLHSFQRESGRLLRDATKADVLGAFGVECPVGGVDWVGSVHRAWLEVSGQQRNLVGRLKQRCNPVHPWVLAREKQRFTRRRYRRIVVMTDQIKQDLMRFYNVPAADVTVIPNGFSPQEFSPQRVRELRGEMRAQLGYEDGDQVVVFVANELERKGFGPLLRSIAALGDERVHLLAVGRLNAEAYAAETKRLGLQDRVQFVGSTRDVGTYYAAADHFALPTQYEAWGLVIVEALACGLPVLTSRSAGAAVTVREGLSGYLLDDPNSVSEITEKLGLVIAGRHASGDEISHSVQEFAWSSVLTHYERLLEQCAREG